MPTPWKPEVELTDADAARLVGDQFPDLAPVRLELLGAGWDNAAYVVNGAWVFRFPRRALALELLEAEIAHLPAIAPRLPVPITAPERIGRPQGGYPYPFAGYRRLAGETACRAGLDHAGRAALAVPIARFLRALHDLPPAPTLPAPPHREDRVGLVARFEGWIAARDDAGAVRRELSRLARSRPWAGAPTLLHGDLYPRHVLVLGGALAGVIDWGDVSVGDPARDLSIGWTLIPAEARDVFLEAYGPADADTRERVRFHALRYAVALEACAADTGDAALRTAAAWCLEGALG